MKVPFRLSALVLFLVLGVSAVAQDAEPAIELEVDVKPLPLRTPPPAYPQHLMARKISGLVALSITIDDRGVVSKCEILKSTEPGFDKAALEAVRKWRFKPAEKAGKKVWTRVQLPLQFTPEGI